jgi:hypothetical protein
VVAVVLTGAGFGYWMVRRFIISKDGSVDAGIAQFVKWAMRVVAIFFITQVGFFSNAKYSSHASMTTLNLGYCLHKIELTLKNRIWHYLVEHT